MGRDPRHEGSGFKPSTVTLAVVLVAAAMGAISLVRQRPNPHLAQRIPPPAWPVGGHDASRSGHSLSIPTAPPITLLQWRIIPRIARAPVVDGYGNAYLARSDGALLALDANLDTQWCAAQQAITDTSCTGPSPAPPPQALQPPVTPHAMVGSDGNIYVVGAGGKLRAYNRSSAQPLWSVFAGLLVHDGVVFGRDAATLYGVVPDGRLAGNPAFAVAAVRWQGVPARGWNRVPIASRQLTPVSIAPDGTVLVAAAAPRPGGSAMLYALDRHSGAILWHLRLAPGRPSDVAVEGSARQWVAWVAVAGARRSWVVAAGQTGRAIWRWSTGRMLTVSPESIALAHPSSPRPQRNGLAYVGSSIGVYGLDLHRRKGWLFYSTRAYGATGAPITDVEDTVYFATADGRIFDVTPAGRVRWQYDTYRSSPGPLALYPDGAVLVTTRDAGGAVVAEKLGAGGAPLATATAALCAPADCPTATPTSTASPLPTATSSPTPAPTTAATATAVTTPTPSATVTITATAAVTAQASVGATPAIPSPSPTR